MKIKSLVASVGVTLLLGCSNSPPSDRAMEAKFREHRAEFDEFVEMFQADGLWVIYRDPPPEYKPLKILPVDRTAKYRQLLTKIDITVAIRSRNGMLYLREWAIDRGNYMGEAKFYACTRYLKRDPEELTHDTWPSEKNIVNSLDEVTKSGEGGYVFKKIADDWYLHLAVEN